MKNTASDTTFFDLDGSTSNRGLLWHPFTHVPRVESEDEILARCVIRECREINSLEHELGVCLQKGRSEANEEFVRLVWSLGPERFAEIYTSEFVVHAMRRRRPHTAPNVCGCGRDLDMACGELEHSD
jgi:hypothetical protein